jgi:hypothetical protein
LIDATDVSFGLLVALLASLLLNKIRKPRLQVARYGSQRMCPFCGLITSRLKTRCLECGKSLTTVSVTQIIEK